MSPEIYELRKTDFLAVANTQKTNIRDKLTKLEEEILYKRWTRREHQTVRDDVENMVQQIIDAATRTGYQSPPGPIATPTTP